MSSIQPIAVLGGTGKAGRYLVQELIKHAIPVRLLVRRPQKLSLYHPLIDVVQGDARDQKSIEQLIKGCRGIISTLGQPAGESPIFSEATRQILNAMKQYGVKRYVIITGLQVDVPGDHKSADTAAKTAWMKANYPATTGDKQLEYELLHQSDIDWTLVRLPWIVQTTDQPQLSINLKDCPGEQVSAASLGLFLIQQLENRQYIRQAPFVSNKRNDAVTG